MGSTYSPTNWYPDNFSAIQQVIKDLSTGSTGTEATAAAVFDFDNTCIFRDIGQAVFRYQASVFRYKLTPDEFAEILPSTEGKPLLLENHPLQQINDELVKRFALLRNKLPETPGTSQELKEFSVLLQWFVQKARQQKELGPNYVLPMLCQLFAGFSIPELKQFADEVITEIGKEPLEPGKECIELAPFGKVTVTYDKGIRPFEEMRSLMHWLSDKGVRCHVISASTTWLVQHSVLRFDFPVQQEDIYGIRCEVGENQIIQIALPASYPVTFRQGKAEVIRQLLRTTPVLVAGDADTDFEMLTLPDIPLRLIINRNQKGAISTLYDNPAYLLQGLDSATGIFRPFRETT